MVICAMDHSRLVGPPKVGRLVKVRVVPLYDPAEQLWLWRWHGASARATESGAPVLYPTNGVVHYLAC
jgi:hypothetical protein